jgi:hypothetical protein
MVEVVLRRRIRSHGIVGWSAALPLGLVHCFGRRKRMPLTQQPHGGSGGLDHAAFSNITKRGEN